MKRWVLLFIGLGLLGAASFYWLRDNSEKSDAGKGSFEEVSKKGGSLLDRLPKAEDLENSLEAHRVTDPSSREGSPLQRHLAAMDGVGPDAETIYQESLAELRKDPAGNIRNFFETYQQTGETHYVDRWKAVYTIASIQDNSGLEALQSIAKQPIPPERFPESHGIGSAGQERVIRVTAIDGLAALSKNGNQEAEAALLQLVSEAKDVPSLRRAIRGYLASGDNYEERAELLRSKVDPSHHRLITLEITSPDEVMQGLEFDLEEPSTSSVTQGSEAVSRWLESLMLPVAWAEECYHPVTEGKNGEAFVDVPAIYESHYSSAAWCSKAEVEKMWKDFKFEDKIWNVSAGVDQPCNLDFPLGRTFNTLWLLLISHPDPAWNLADRSGSILRWGYNYAATVSTHLRLACDGSITHALAFYNTPSRTMNVTWSWAMGSDIISRAGTIIHEARHNNKPHSVERTCIRGMSCDPDWDYDGANTYEVSWYWAFYHWAVRTTTAHKDRAKVLGQDVLDTGFINPPGLTIY